MIVLSQMKSPDDFAFTFGEPVAMSTNGNNHVVSALTKSYYIFYSYTQDAYVVEKR